MPPSSFDTFSIYHLGYGPVFATRDSWIALPLAKMEDKGLLSPWASALVLSAEAEALLTIAGAGERVMFTAVMIAVLVTVTTMVFIPTSTKP